MSDHLYKTVHVAPVSGWILLYRSTDNPAEFFMTESPALLIQECRERIPIPFTVGGETPHYCAPCSGEWYSSPLSSHVVFGVLFENQVVPAHRRSDLDFVGVFRGYAEAKAFIRQAGGTWK